MPDLHDLVPEVDTDAAWHIFTRIARQRRRSRRRFAAALTTAAVIAAGAAIAHVDGGKGSSGRVNVVNQPTVPQPTVVSSRACTRLGLAAAARAELHGTAPTQKPIGTVRRQPGCGATGRRSTGSVTGHRDATTTVAAPASTAVPCDSIPSSSSVSVPGMTVVKECGTNGGGYFNVRSTTTTAP